MSSVTIAVDIAKNVFEIAISAAAGRIHERRRMTRHQFERFWSTRDPCRVVMEGCSGSHYWARLLIGLGFEVKLERAGEGHTNRAANKLARIAMGRLAPRTELRR